MNLDTPPGVTKVDANSIVPESNIFLHYGKLASFSDYFRYVMVKKTNEMWVDADTICLSEYFFEDKEYVFIEEMPNFYAQGILKMPSDSDLCKFLNKKALELMVNKNEVGNPESKNWTGEDSKKWIFLGPGLFTDAINKFYLQEHGQPALIVNGLDISVSKEDPYDLLWNPDNYNLMSERLVYSVSVTFFNSSLDWRGLTENKNHLPEGSMMWELQKKFLPTT
jgi:hypothetical protein